jgi:PKD repeat protein
MNKKNLHKIAKSACLFLLGVFALGTSHAQVTTITVQDSIDKNAAPPHNITHWTACNQYLLKGYVYVINGTTLIIDAGTIVKGDKNTKGCLIVERGAKIIAQGTLAQPIIFTSNQPAGQRTYGDWGGVVLCGKAFINSAGGTAQVEGGPRSFCGGGVSPDQHDSSGVFSYCRIEFAGVALSPNNEINSLSLYAVGDKTKIDHVQCSYGGDDSFEYFGGTVNTKYLVAFRGWDDDYDTDNGYRGNNQFIVGIRDPFAADVSGSKGMESDSYGGLGNPAGSGGAGDTAGLTRPVFSNVTLIGPMVSPTTTAYDPQFVSAVHIRRGSALSLMNSVIAGFPAGILFDESLVYAPGPPATGYGSTVRNYEIQGAAGDTIGQIRNNIIAGIPTNATPVRKEVEYVYNGARSLTPTNAEGDTTTGTPFNPWSGPFNMFWNNPVNGPSTGNVTKPTEQSGVILGGPFNLANPNLIPNSTSPIVFPVGNPAVKPSFSSKKLQNSFFTPTTYVGAFNGTGNTSDNWMNGWCNFDPNNADYSGTSAPLASITPLTTTTFCQGGSVILQANAGSSYTYQWQMNNTNIAAATSQNYTANMSGVYNVIVTSAGGCSVTSSTTTVTVNPVPTASVTAGGPTVFCTGGNVVLSANSATGYSWSTGATTSSITVTTSGNYNVMVTNASGCTSASSNIINVSVSSSPAPTITANGATAICQGNSVTLTASTSDTYMWSPGGATTQSIVASSAASYTVTVTNSNACNGTGASAATAVTVNAVPTASFTFSGTVPSITFVNSSAGATAYTWDFGDGNFSNTSAPTHIYGSNAVYTVCLIATNATGCSDSTCHSVNINTAVQEIENISSISLYPNPVSNEATLEFVLGDNQEVSVVIMDLTGKTVFSMNDKFSAGQNAVKIDARDMRNGVYLTRIVTKNASTSVKTIVLK